MIGAKAVVVSDPFMAAAPLLSQLGMRVLTIEQLLDSRPIDPVETDDDDVALLQLTSGSTGSPKAVRISHRNVVSNAEAMFVGANVDRRYRRDRELAAAVPRHGHDRLLDRADVFRRRAGQGHADGLPARHPAVGQAHRQVQGHDDRGAELRLHDVRQTPSQAGPARPVRPVHAAVGAVGRRTGRTRRRRGPLRSRQRRSGYVRRRSCPLTAWPRRPWRCRSPSAARA